MKKQVVIWYGVPLRKDKRVCELYGRSYWWCTMLVAPYETHIFSLKE